MLDLSGYLDDNFLMALLSNASRGRRDVLIFCSSSAPEADNWPVTRIFDVIIG